MLVRLQQLVEHIRVDFCIHYLLPKILNSVELHKPLLLQRYKHLELVHNIQLLGHQLVVDLLEVDLLEVDLLVVDLLAVDLLEVDL